MSVIVCKDFYDRCTPSCRALYNLWMNAYPIPADSVSTEEVIKKSRFITLLSHTEDIESARAFIRQIKAAHPTAAHHCWAYVAGAPADSQVLGFSDDGEPSGTAGKPMLAQLQGSGVGEVTAVVVRYFGGIELGTGGLVKAYGQGVQKALKLLPVKTKVPMHTFTLHVDYTMLSDVTHLIARFDGQIISQAFTDGVRLTFALPMTKLAEFDRSLSDLSRGTLTLVRDE
jgi:uncharacterized YigZ family protein